MLPRRLTNGSQLPPSATAAPAFLLQTVQALGFIINWDKSELTPTQCPNRATIDIPRQLARPSPEEDRHFVAVGPATPWPTASPGQDMASVPGGFLSRLVDVRPDCRLLMRPLQLFFSGITNRAGTPYPDGSPCPDDPPPLPEVEPSGIPAHGQPIEGPQPTITVTTDASHTGWGSLPGPHCLWGLVPLQPEGTPPYQCAGVSGCLSVTPSLPPPCSAPHCTYPYGQRHSCCIHKQTRVHTHSARLNTPSGGVVDLVQAQGFYPDCLLHPRPRQFNRRFSVPRPCSPLGVDPPPPGHGLDSSEHSVPYTWICLRRYSCPAPEILHEGSGLGSVANRRLLVSVGGIQGVRFSPDLSHSPNSI